jgi:hypothetical protein
MVKLPFDYSKIKKFGYTQAITLPNFPWLLQSRHHIRSSSPWGWFWERWAANFN